jgi:hypothetical protein
MQSAFDTFVEKHCEVAPGAHVGCMEIQSAICVYMNQIGMYDDHMRWIADTDDDQSKCLFDHFGARMKGIVKSGTRAHPVLSGIRLKSWPHA